MGIGILIGVESTLLVVCILICIAVIKCDIQDENEIKNQKELLESKQCEIDGLRAALNESRRMVSTEFGRMLRIKVGNES